MCVSYAPLCCRHCQSHPPGLLALGLGGWSLSQERSHLMDGRLILRLEIYRKSILLFQWSNIPTVNTPPPGLSNLDFQVFVLTCEHAFIDNAGAADQYGVAWHDGPIAGDDHQITRHQICRQNLFDFCQEPGCNEGVEMLNIKYRQVESKQN